MKRHIQSVLILIAITILLGLDAVALEPKPRQSEGSLAMLDIGQGDSLLVTAPSGAQMLIDGGKDSAVLTQLGKVMPAGDRFIDVVIATHPDADHIGGLPLVLRRYRVGLYLTSQVASDSQVYKDLNQLIIDRKIPAYFVRKGMVVRLDPVTRFTVLFPNRDTTGWETNTASVVGRLDIGQSSGLLTGDSPTSIETYLTRTTPQLLDVDVLKLGHHGSKTSSSEDFLRAASPDLALISAGVNNRYGHPATEVIERLKSLKIPWVSTQDKGTVVLTPAQGGWAVQK